ncbi:O-acyltransferase, WSD1, C-terminal [Cynara cardunculus var. scolymus]|uniref:O-acyltransferase, WSD1, C-terminal n=1 Tax=Cynara cardunculus var. scolymus TaxID=59895 RepID=A0A118K528_CYNCS|nr:O-acyltransferase, WSD1, C-terminal [Cynara cardunculus var. scolymus]
MIFPCVEEILLKEEDLNLWVEDENGGKHWKQVEVKVEDHMIAPRFPDGLSLESYDVYIGDYLSGLGMDPFPKAKPLWEIHVIKYPTSKSSGSLIFKLHHALGDGYTIMGVMLSCLQRADNPSIPLTFPSFRKPPKPDNGMKSILSLVPQVLSGVVNTVLDFGMSILQSSLLEDSSTPIRSAEEGVEFLPTVVTTMTFSLDQIKQIKDILEVTINDIVSGVIFLGTRLYMEATSNESGNARSTSLVLLNTRSIGGYRSVDEMLHNPEAQNLWGNQFAFLQVSLPKLRQAHNSLDPLKFVYEAHNIIKRKRNSSAVYLTGMLLESIRKYRGTEAAAKYVHLTQKNASMGLTNLAGPIEKMSLCNQPIKGLYFMIFNVPQVSSFPNTNQSALYAYSIIDPMPILVDATFWQSYKVTVMSYMNQLRVTLGTQKGFIDPMKLKRCIEEAYDMILKAALNSK